ncbi:MAG: NUDIX hydrolase [Solirubrobacterales bacterium]|nr:NUDIX hydrolase [Solirubrobacterales bacterium]
MSANVELLTSETPYRGAIIDVSVKRYRRADGSEVDRQVVEHPGAVAIVAHDGEAVYLVRQPREAIEEDGSLEIPAGALDVEGESELECAERELSEEIGLAAEDWEVLHVIYAAPGYSDERITIFLATGLSEAPGESDEDELLETVRVPPAELEATLAGIHDAMSLTGLLLLRERLAGR